MFKAKGISNASDFVENVLQAYLSSSEETVFGSIFFEPLALEASKAKGGMKTGSTGVDIEYVSANTHTAIAVKSATNAQNSSAQNKQNAEFIKINQTVRATGKAFDAIIGYSYGRATGAPEGKIYRRLAGQAFWQELSGDSEFYLKILSAMKDYPTVHRKEYDVERTKLSNRLVQGFSLNFINSDGQIDWEKLLRFNSGTGRPGQLLKVQSDPQTGQTVIAEDRAAEAELGEDLPDAEEE